MVKFLTIIFISILIISCGPSDEEIEIKINQEFDKLIKSYPTATPAPIPTPKERLDNPTKKQKESLELEKEK